MEEDKEYSKLLEKIQTLADDAREEYDMIELVEDSIRDVFKCSLNCKDCSKIEQGTCMQNFKKANLYWLRKIVQDEKYLKDCVDKMYDMKEALEEMMMYAKKVINNLKENVHIDPLETKPKEVKTDKTKDFYFT
jgi:hypothetical protein